MPEIKQMIQENGLKSLNKLQFNVIMEPNKDRVRTLIEKANALQLREIIRILSEQS